MEQLKDAYACINTDDKIRQISSSGGLFYALAKSVIDAKGIVFGARFDNDFNVVIDFSKTLDETKVFCGSKYVQAKIGINYQKAKEFLDNDRFVLFTGTPCQVSGLRTFLKKDYPNLLCIDFICHGTPKPQAWQKYLKYISHKNRTSKITNIEFRNKTKGWLNFNVVFTFNDGSTISNVFRNDKYMRGFLDNKTLRNSCYHCPFRGEDRVSDITLADFWGIQKNYPDMFDDKGTSLVILNTQKGRDYFNKINPFIRYKKVDFALALKSNPSYYKDPIKKRLYTEITKKIKRIIKRLLGKKI